MEDVRFLGSAARQPIVGRPVLIGCPLDATCTYRPGTAEAPAAIRVASDSIETYSPLLDRDLEDLPFADTGDLPLLGKSIEAALATVETAVSEALSQGALPLCVGGEHTITLPIVTALRHVRDDFVVMHLDAHTDLRDEYEGSTVNHATVMRRVADLLGPDRLVQLGIRSGTREEFSWMRTHGTLRQWDNRTDKILMEAIGHAPVYLTVDLDVLDPACLPGTGNPEAGGWFYQDMERFLRIVDRLNLVAADVVELNPGLDPSESSTITAAKVVRELLVILGSSR
jgi:agmatinase